MTKSLVTEAQLRQVINSAIAQQWKFVDRTCRIEKLKPSGLPECNWTVDTMSTGGPDLSHSGECESLRRSVLATLAEEYEVDWTQEA